MIKSFFSSFFYRFSFVSLLTLINLFISVQPSLALGPPPETKNALWWQQIWGTLTISPKIVQEGEILTATAKIVGGGVGLPRWVCTQWGWMTGGTGSVGIGFDSSLFELVDYEPKASSAWDVSVSASAVRWEVKIDEKPALGWGSRISDTCYCSVLYWGGAGSCNTREDVPDNLEEFSHQGFVLHLRAKGGTCTWNLFGAGFSGGLGALGWSDTATDYYAVSGTTQPCELGLRLTADPGTTSSDDSIDLTAAVYDLDSGVEIPDQQVDFEITTGGGFVSPDSEKSDADGNVESSLHSGGLAGNVTVQAAIPNGPTDNVSVYFTPVDPPDLPESTAFGDDRDIPYTFDPVHPGIGNYVYSRNLFSFPGVILPFAFKVIYNSKDAASERTLGFGWSHSYDIVVTEENGIATVKWGNGRTESFLDTGSGTYQANGGNTPGAVFTHPDPDSSILALPRGISYLFDGSGRLVTIQDRNNNQVVLNHSSQLDKITDSAGREIFFHYAGGRLIAVTSPYVSGNTASFIYDGLGDLIEIIDAGGKSRQFSYDNEHRVLAYTDALGHPAIRNQYDAEGRVEEQTNALDQVTTYEYTVSPSETVVKMTPPSGNYVFHYYDTAHNITKIIDGEGGVADFRYNDKGQRLGQTDKKGVDSLQSYDDKGGLTFSKKRHGVDVSVTYDTTLNLPVNLTNDEGSVTSLTYDGLGNLSSMTNVLGRAVSMSHDSRGLPLTFTDAKGNRRTFTYDAAGLVSTATDPLGNVTTFERDDVGRLTRMILPDDQGDYQFSYDSRSNVLTRTDPAGRVTSYSYDDNNNLLTRTFEPSGAVTSYEYDLLNRITKIIDPLAGETIYTYDADGNLNTVTDPDNVTSTFTYDKANRLTAVTDGLGQAKSYGYDANGNMTSITDNLSHTWTFVYDEGNRLQKVTDPAGDVSTYYYDKLDRITGAEDGEGRMLNFSYDALGQQQEISHAGQGRLSSTYGLNGRLIMLTDSNLAAWHFRYDALNRLSTSRDPLGREESFSYDVLSRLVSKILRSGEELTYGYDAAGRLQQISWGEGNTLSYGYDGAGNMLSVQDPSGTTTMTYDLLGRRTSLTDRNGKAVSFTYTPAGRVKTITYPGDKVLTYDYDTLGRLVTMSDWLGNQTTYQYDVLNRVEQVTNVNATKTLFTYDATGRLQTMNHLKSDDSVLHSFTYTYNAAGQIATVDGVEVPATLADENTSYTVNALNQVTGSELSGVQTDYLWDENGRLVSQTTGSATTTSSYDAMGRLLSRSEGTNTTTYAYDGKGGRVAKNHNGVMTNYLRDSSRLFCTYGSDGTISRYFIHAGKLLYSLDGSGNMYVYHDDERGSVLSVSDNSETLIASYLYSPYGKVLSGTGSIDNPFQFIGTRGVEYDETGLSSMMARYYDPGLKRFISPDPIGVMAASNLYSYTSGDPVNWLDPMGMEEDQSFWTNGARCDGMGIVNDVTQVGLKEAWKYGVESSKVVSSTTTNSGIVMNTVKPSGLTSVGLDAAETGLKATKMMGDTLQVIDYGVNAVNLVEKEYAYHSSKGPTSFIPGMMVVDLAKGDIKAWEALNAEVMMANSATNGFGNPLLGTGISLMNDAAETYFYDMVYYGYAHEAEYEAMVMEARKEGYLKGKQQADEFSAELDELLRDLKEMNSSGSSSDYGDGLKFIPK
ncbi:MAG: hypothetical protein KQH63_00035 [Desulfobulbaceae bacterium]|nr:hypothetical protein [Desulfobulbaceae bacterium]